VWGEAQGIRLVGMPDHIVWAESKPLWLLELKTTRGDPTPLWEDQENQVRIYGLLLELMGFDCSRMRLAVVRLKTNELDEAEKREWIVRVSEALLVDKITELEAEHRGMMKAHLLKHDRALAEAAIAQKAGYWLNQREPTSSTSVGKCRACEYRSACPKSLFKDAQSS
jgi:PD-(D/E)XK nuclease superfamily protein